VISPIDIITFIIENKRFVLIVCTDRLLMCKMMRESAYV